MKITVGLFGFGKTGSVVANEIINADDCELKWVLRKSLKNEGEYASHLLGNSKVEGKIFSLQNLELDKFYNENKVDVIIDFSASSAIDEYKDAVKHGIKIVSAISHYTTEEVIKLEDLSKVTAILYSPNITLGINLLIEASKMLHKVATNADIEIVEEHFKEKMSVSGTALKIAEELGLDSKTHVKSIRAGGIVGKHEVIFGLPNQTIRIIHESISRAAFGQGAIYAAKWIMGKDKGIFSMRDALETEIGSLRQNNQMEGSVAN